MAERGGVATGSVVELLLPALFFFFLQTVKFVYIFNLIVAAKHMARSIS